MASSKVMPSTSTSNSRNSNLSPLSSHHHHHNHHRNNHHPPPPPSTSSSPMISDFSSNSDHQRTTSDLPSPMTVDGILRDVYGETPVVDAAEITLIDAAGAISAIDNEVGVEAEPSSIRRQNSGGMKKTVDDVWREIVARKSEKVMTKAVECKVEAPDEMMTLEAFLAKAGAVEGEGEVEEEVDVKMVASLTMSNEGLGGGGSGLFGFDPMIQGSYPGAGGMGEGGGGLMGFGSGGGGGVEVVGRGRGKRRGGPILEPLDKAAQQRQRRMIKNRESAARSRERKHAYQIELESLAVKLEEENEQLRREKAERTKERYKQLMEKVVPVVEKRRPPRVLRRVKSMQW